MDQMIEIEIDRRRFTFTLEQRGPLRCWTVECEGKIWPSPVTYTGQEKPGFFRSMAQSAMEHHGL